MKVVFVELGVGYNTPGIINYTRSQTNGNADVRDIELVTFVRTEGKVSQRTELVAATISEPSFKDTCLAGDIIGDYSFDRPLAVGDVLEFGDMAIYSMVKNNTFNGMPLPSIALRTLDGTERCIRSFGYEDFKQRLS